MSPQDQEEVEFAILEYLYSIKDTGEWVSLDTIRDTLVTRYGRHNVSQVFTIIEGHKQLVDSKKESGRETFHISFAGESRYIKLLSNRDLQRLQSEVLISGIQTNKSVIDTNENVRKTNDVSVNLASKMNLFTAATAVFALCSVVVAIVQCNMSKTDKPIPELQRLDTTLQSQARELDSLKQTLRTVDSVLVRIADSLSMK